VSSVVVFSYHHVSPVRGAKFSVTPGTLEGQLAALKKKGYEPLFVHEAAQVIRGERALNSPGVCITLDDGYLDNYLFGFEVLKKLGMKATIFAVTSWVDAATERFGSRRLRDVPPAHGEIKRLIEEGRHEDAVFTWDEAEEMLASGLVTVESHGHRHEEAPELSKRGELVGDLTLSRWLISERLGHRSNCVCWPYGEYDSGCLEDAKSAGFVSAATVERGVNRAGSDPFRIKRITAKEAGPGWALKVAFIFSSPFWGGFYARIKPR
jgi:peptidoglycan/xylan/chitin deacetylase (PgdA/CDA1 family)